MKGLIFAAVVIGIVATTCGHHSNSNDYNNPYYTGDNSSVSGNTDIHAPQCADFSASLDESISAGGYGNMTSYQQQKFDEALHKCRGN